MLSSLYESVSSAVFYLLIYNISLLSVFSLVLSLNSSSLKTLSSLTFLTKSTKKYALILHFFSIAGLPPFLGFITKINLIVVGVNSSIFFFFIFFSFFFSVLYFYIQNIKFLLQPVVSEKLSLSLFTFSNSSIFFIIQGVSIVLIIFGLFFLEDLLLLVSWFFIY